MSESVLRLALCADKNVIVGLHVTLHSSLKNTQSFVEILLIHQDFSHQDIENLHTTLSPFKGRYTLNAVRFDASKLASLRSHRGNIYTYARLMIGEFLDADRVIYLDTDLLVNRDLQPLYDVDLEGKLFAAVPFDQPETTVENHFFQEISMAKGGESYFNAGVVVFNLDRWRREDCLSAVLTFAEKHGDRIPTMDQTLLNYLALDDGFVHLEKRWNSPVYASSRIRNMDQTVIHFLSVPKPWDIGAEYFHKCYREFKGALSETSFRDYRPSLDITINRLKIAARSARGYYLAVRSGNR